MSYIRVLLVDDSSAIRQMIAILLMLTKSFVERLQSKCRMTVLETGRPQPLKSAIYVATGGMHTVVERSGQHVQIFACEGLASDAYLPSADILLHSVAKVHGGNCLVGMMGTNGLKGCEVIRSWGGNYRAGSTMAHARTGRRGSRSGR
jgi:chemotaxis response regulator CheB